MWVSELIFAAVDGFDRESSASFIEQDQDDENQSIFPNPGRNVFNIATSQADTKRLIYRIYTTEGKIVKTGIINSGIDKIDLSDVPAGIYVFSCIDRKRNLLSNKNIIVN